jgi:Na+/H+ antiporter NhaC
MFWLLLAALPQELDRFEATILRDGKERDYLVGDLPFDLRVRALDGVGRPLESFAGPAHVAGLADLATIGPFENGQVVLKGVRRVDPTVTFRAAGRSTEWSPRRIPGWLSLAPPILAIVLSILTRQVLVALAAGVLGGALLVDPWTGFLRMFDTYLRDAVANPSNAAILVFSLALGGMVGIVTRSGGAHAMVEAIARRARTRRSGQLTAWLMGLIVFFDDYANCLLVGNVVRPLTDRLKISREKLSFIVDATAAPVATLAFVSTWIGFQLGQFANTGVIEPGREYEAFLRSLPYSFYSLLLILFVFLIAAAGRDFGPMRGAERRAATTGQLLRPGAAPMMDRELTDMKVPEGSRLKIRNAVVPLAAVILLVVGGLYADGAAKAARRSDALRQAIAAGSTDATQAARELAELTTLRGKIAQADSFAVLLWASFGGTFVAAATALTTRALTLGQTTDAWVTGAKSMMMALLILVLAWALGGICRERLDTGPWVISLVHPPPQLLPLIVFLACCLISFATGTSYGTMAIVFPIAGPLAWALTQGTGLAPEHVEAIRYATLGSVLAGAVFGDHCSPISDTTVMSSMASACDHLDHVKTQMPYALACGGVAALTGYLPVGFGLPAWASLTIGAALIAAIVWGVGRRVEEPSPSA